MTCQVSYFALIFLGAGCAHAQQLIWQLFNAIEKGFNASGDSDTAFLKGESTCFLERAPSDSMVYRRSVCAVPDGQRHPYRLVGTAARYVAMGGIHRYLR